MTATREQIVYHFLNVQRTVPNWRAYNWGTEPRDQAHLWDVDDLMHSEPEWDTYINGVPLSIDADYYAGDLLEVCERSSGVVSYVVVVTFHGFKNKDQEDWDIEHDSEWYQPICGTFFERTEAADDVTVGQWAVSVIYGMMASYAERQSGNRPDELPPGEICGTPSSDPETRTA